MVEFGYTSIADGTVLRPNWFPNQASATEILSVQTSSFSKFNYCLKVKKMNTHSKKISSYCGNKMSNIVICIFSKNGEK
jgi:hypothetical protein